MDKPKKYNSNNGVGSALRLGRERCGLTTTHTLPHKENRAICVKAIDVFGFESVVVERV